MLDMESAKKGDEAQLRKLMHQSGLETAPPGIQGNIDELDKRNIGIYYYQDREGNNHRIPMTPDWGAVHWPEELQGNKEKQLEYIKKWESIPDLKPWYNAATHFSKDIENVINDAQLQTIGERTGGGEREGAIFSAIKHRGLTDEEIGALSTKARRSKDYYQKLVQLIENYDTSQPPLGRSR